MFTAEDLRKKLCSLISAFDSNLGIEIAMPILYPDGEHVTVVVSESPHGFLVSDHGFGAMNLAKEGIPLSKKTREKLAALATRYHCTFSEDSVQRTCAAEDLPTAIMIVANASRTIGDQALDIRHRMENEFKATVTEILIEIVGDANRVKAEEEFKGLSGRKYRVDNVVLDKQLKEPRAFVESIYNRAMILGRAAQVQDLKTLHSIEIDVALDDQQLWKDEDKKLFENFGADHILVPSQLKPVLTEVFMQ